MAFVPHHLLKERRPSLPQGLSPPQGLGPPTSSGDEGGDSHGPSLCRSPVVSGTLGTVPSPAFVCSTKALTTIGFS